MAPPTAASHNNNSAQWPISPQRRALFWGVALALGFLRVWAHRHDVNPDGLEYIEIAWAATHVGMRAFVNGYWSPLYPFLLSRMFRVFHPAILFESTAVQLLNLVIYLTNLACFELFLRELLRLRARVARSIEATAGMGDRAPLHAATLVNIGYLFFVWTSYVWLSPTLVTPDLCVAALAYLAMALLLRIRNGQGTWTIHALLGVTLGLAYLAKAAMFPVAFFFLGSSLIVAARTMHSWARAVRHTLLAAIIFLLLAAPLVRALSKEVHRLSFGESGRDNYAWYVNRSSMVYWQGGPADMGTPTHPARQLLPTQLPPTQALDGPPLFEFASPIPGSFPPGYEPSYWYEGVRPHLQLYAQMRALLRGLNFYLQMFSRTGVLYIVFLALFLTLRRGGRWSTGDLLEWKLWLPAYAALGLYALVHVEPRFVGEFALMLLTALFASIQLPRAMHTTSALQPAPAARFFTATCLTAVLILSPAIAIAASAAFDLAALRTHPGRDDFRLAESLAALTGSQPESVATIGMGPSFYWAHLAGVRVVADLPSAASYWNASPDAQANARAQLQHIGVETVISARTKNVPQPDPASGWNPVAKTNYFVRQLR